MVDNDGITKNLSNILDEAGLSQSDLSRVTSDAGVRTALYNGLLEEMSIFQGDSAKSAETLGGRLSAMGTKASKLKVAIGDALRPAIEILADVLGNALSGALRFVTRNMFAFKTAALVVGTAVAIMANIVIGAVKIMMGAFESLFSLSWEPLANAVASAGGQMINTWVGANEKMTDIAEEEVGKQVEAVEGGTKKMADAHNKKTEKMLKDLAKETEAYERELDKRQKRFQQSLEDLIWSHIDKRDRLEEDLAEENADFAEKMSDRVRDFDEAMEDMKKSHREKVDDIKEQIDEELGKQKETNEERLKNLQEVLRKEKQALDRLEGDESARLDAKIANLKRNYEYEVALGKGSEQDLFNQLQDRILEEKAVSAQHTKDLVGYKKEQIERIKQEEQAKIDDEKAKDAERLNELRNKLNEEVAEHEMALTKKEEVFVRETTRMQEEHDKREADLQERLDNEKEILAKHQGDVSAMKGKVKEDDITRLKNQFAEERKNAEADHQRKMKEVKERGGAEGTGYIDSLGKPILDGVDQLNKDMKEKMDTLTNTMGEKGEDAGEALVMGYIKGIAKKFMEGGEKVQLLLQKIPGFEGFEELIRSKENQDFFSKAHFLHTGGTVPGPIGADVPIMAQAGEKILPAGISQDTGGGGGGVSFTVNVGIYAGAQTEKRELAKELYASLVQLSESQNKTVAQLFNQ